MPLPLHCAAPPGLRTHLGPRPGTVSPKEPIFWTLQAAGPGGGVGRHGAPLAGGPPPPRLPHQASLRPRRSLAAQWRVLSHDGPAAGPDLNIARVMLFCKG